MSKPRRSAVHRGMEILYDPPERKKSAQWSVSGGFLHGRIFFGSQGQAKRHIDESKDGVARSTPSAVRARQPAPSRQPTMAQSASFKGSDFRGEGDLEREFHARAVEPTAAVMPSSGKTVRVPTVLRTERHATGGYPRNFGTVPNKPAIRFGREIMYPEIVLVRLLEDRGWVAAWRKNWQGKAFWRAIGEDVAVPGPVRVVVDQLAAAVGGKGGAWDVIAWKGNQLLFVESKKHQKDKLRPTQLAWLEQALAAGMRMESFAIVEYVIE